jgi:uncharacterized membrane protein YgaE (UPF0421/DUF939 family)
VAEHSTADQLRRLERRVRRQLDVTMAGRRAWNSLPAIGQIMVAVAAAYSITHWGLGHAVPILAVTLTINALGLSRDARPVRVAESVLGIVLGVALSEGLSLIFGKGLWQLMVVLLVVFVVGRLVSTKVTFAVAAAVPSALVLLLPIPPGGPFTRTLDAAVGGVVALLVTALIPRDPTRASRRDGRVLFSVLSESTGSIVDSLRDADSGAGELAPTRLRRTQPLIDDWNTSLDTALSVSRISPLLRRQLPELKRDVRALAAADLAARHLRTLSRRIEYLVRDGGKRPALAGIMHDIQTGITQLGAELGDLQLAGQARSLLSDLARRLDPAVIIPDAGVTDAAIVLMVRPLVIDLLVGTGLPADDARALLPPL